jgi:hypothetical protein
LTVQLAIDVLQLLTVQLAIDVMSRRV